MRRSIVIGLALLAVAFLFVGGPSLLFSPSTDEVVPEEEDGPEPQIVTLEDSESGFWPYLNAEERHEQRSPLNVVVRGELDRVVLLLSLHGDGEWEEAEHDHFDADEFVDNPLNQTDDGSASSTDETADGVRSTTNETADEGNSTTNETAGEGNSTTDTSSDQPVPDRPTNGQNATDDTEEDEAAVNDTENNETVADDTENNETVADDTENNETVADDTENNETVADAIRPVSPTDIPWSQADGATRLAYLDPGPDGESYWTTETLQLEDGEYYGYRYHVRAYESPNPSDRWVVMQTHSEHFDWFTLRHRVDGVEQAQARLESDLMEIPGVDIQEDVQRMYLDNSGPSDADGWATTVDLTAMALAPVALSLAAGKRRETHNAPGRLRERAGVEIDSRLTDDDRERLRAVADRLEARHLLLAATILTIILGIRIAGIALDRTTGFLTVHMIAALLYPFIALGLPVATYAIANGLERRFDAAIATSVSLAVAIWLDYSLLGVDVIPIDVIVQRAFVVVALGLIAGGAANRATRDSRLNDMLVVGIGLWTLVLVGTLLGYL